MQNTVAAHPDCSVPLILPPVIGILFDCHNQFFFLQSIFLFFFIIHMIFFWWFYPENFGHLFSRMIELITIHSQLHCLTVVTLAAFAFMNNFFAYHSQLLTYSNLLVFTNFPEINSLCCQWKWRGDFWHQHKTSESILLCNLWSVIPYIKCVCVSGGLRTEQ